MSRMTNKEAIELIQSDIKVNNKYLGKRYKEALKQAIKALEEQQWVPCSDRPKKRGRYLVWSDTVPPWPHHILNYDPECDEWFFDGLRSADCEMNVIAWMPLPGPYRDEGKNR